jgi:hypothetical protein
MKKIIVYGPPLAGKRTALELFSGHQNAPIHRFAICGDPSDRTKIPRTADGKIVYASAEEYENTSIKNTGCYLTINTSANTITLLTFSGAVWTDALWNEFVSRADAVALVLDSQPACIETNLRFIRHLDAMTLAPKSGCVLWTKMDHSGKRPDLVESHLRTSQYKDWPAFSCSLTDPSSVNSPFDWLVSQLGSP